MTTAALEILFWSILGLVFWTYLGYPLLLMLLAQVSRRELRIEPIQPSVSVIISAFNEEKHIAQKLLNTLSLDYPIEKLQILVASDCSADDTHSIVLGFAKDGVELVALPHRGGKTAAQNAAVKVARGEILVFTDATTMLQADALLKLVQGFADPRVGCIDAPHESITELGTVVGRGGRSYRRYESVMRDLESEVNSLIGMTGCLYAVRRSLYEPLKPDLISDFVIASKVYSKGYISVRSQGVVTREIAHEDVSKEFEMRVRIVIRSIHGLIYEARMLNPWKYGFFSLQLLSHKVLRYLVPELLVTAIILNVILAWSKSPPHALYVAVLICHLSVYVTALLGWLALKFNIRVPFLHYPFYFVIGNLAALWGLLRYLQGERKVIWTTVR